MWLSSLFQYMVSVFIFVILFLHGRFLETMLQKNLVQNDKEAFFGKNH